MRYWVFLSLVVFLIGGVLISLSVEYQPLAPEVNAQAYAISSNGPLPAADGTYLWSNGGPTAAFSNQNLKTTAVCNGHYCWEWNQTGRYWMRNRQPIKLSSSLSFLLPQNGIYPWSGQGLSAGWENYDTGLLTLNNNKYVWIWSATSNPPDGSWLNDLKPRDLSQSEPWKSAKPGPGGILPWSGQGITSAWTDKATNREYVCQGRFCWVINSTQRTFENNGAPFDLATALTVNPASDGSFPWTTDASRNREGPVAGWTNQTDNVAAICNGPWCWSFEMRSSNTWNLSNVVWKNNGNPTNICASWTSDSSNCPGIGSGNTTPPPTLPPGDTTLKVLSYNILNENSSQNELREIAKYLKNNQIEIAGLQELSTGSSPYAAPILEQELRNAGYPMYMASPPNKTQKYFENAVVSIYPIIDAQYIGMNPCRSDGSCDRYAVVTKIQTPAGVVRFVSAHVHHGEDNCTSLQQLYDIVKNYFNEPLILTGDFNANLSFCSNHLANSYSYACEDANRCYDRDIDWIFLSKFNQDLVQVSRVRDTSMTQSDHFPLVGEIKMVRAAPTELAAPSELSANCQPTSSSNAQASVKLSWKGVAGVDKYVLRLDSAKTCVNQQGQTISWFCEDTATPENGDRVFTLAASKVCDASSLICQTTVPVAGGMMYPSWSVQSKNLVNGQEVLSSITDGGSYLGCLASPTNVQASCTINRAGPSVTTSTFTWSPVSGATAYKIRINTTKTCTSENGSSIDWYCPDEASPENGDQVFYFKTPECNNDRCQKSVPIADGLTIRDWSVQAVSVVNEQEVTSALSAVNIPLICLASDVNGDAQLTQADYNQVVTDLYSNACRSNNIGLCPTQPAGVTILDFNILISAMRR